MAIKKSYYRMVNIYFSEQTEKEAVKEFKLYLNMGYEAICGQIKNGVFTEAEDYPTDESGNNLVVQLNKTTFKIKH